MFLKVVQAASVAVLLALAATRAVEAAPSSLMAARSCSASGLGLTIAWTNSASAVLQQYVDISAENNGWVPGTFQLNGPLGASANSITVPGLSLSATYYARVNQLLANGTWEASDTLTVSPSSVAASTCGPSPSAVAIPPPIAPPPVPVTPEGSPAAPLPFEPATNSATTATPASAPADANVNTPSDLTAWLQSVGVTSQPTIQSFVRDAVAAFQRAPTVPGQQPLP